MIIERCGIPGRCGTPRPDACRHEAGRHEACRHFGPSSDPHGQVPGRHAAPPWDHAGADRPADGSGQPRAKVFMGDSRVSTGHVGSVSISLMRHKSWGSHQFAAQPNLLRARDAPAVVPEPEVTQWANGADESWCISPPLGPGMPPGRRQKSQEFTTENTYDSPVTSKRDHYGFAPGASQMSCYALRGAWVVTARQCRERGNNSASGYCWRHCQQGCPAIPLGTTAWQGRPAVQQCKPRGLTRSLTRGHG